MRNIGECHYQSPRCPSTEFNCRCEDERSGDSPECIPQSWVCDGQRDCTDSSDEIDCMCEPNQYQCYDGAVVRIYQCVDEGNVCDRRFDCANLRDEWGGQCGEGFQCNNGLYIPLAWRCNKYNLCWDYSDEEDCDVRSTGRCDCYKKENDTCKDGARWYSYNLKCDGYAHCPDGSDEWNCLHGCSRFISPIIQPIRCACYKPDEYSCTGSGPVCFTASERCDRYAHCPDGNDEWNCSSCLPEKPFRCACNKIDDYSCTGNGHLCYADRERCNAIKNCLDASDEINCSCPEDKFTCSCFIKDFPTCSMTTGCIPMKYVNDGKLDCDSGSDELYIKSMDTVLCSTCNIDIIRVTNQSVCVSPWCDNSTCNNVPSTQCNQFECNATDVVCTSFCSDYNTSASCDNVFQCSDQSVILNQNFCNSKKDCEDGSDEITSQPGFKCSATLSTIQCVLPQWNIYDSIPQCYDKSDLCFGSDGFFNCFRCLDKRLIISAKQVCDGVIDCFDLSDECLCENPSLTECLSIFSKSSQCNNSLSRNFEADIQASGAFCSGQDCENLLQVDKSLITCKNKWGNTSAITCDGRPECTDFADECESCLNPPAFCNDTCHAYFQMGDRYCDGYIDEAWRYLQDTNCSKGFDENNCPKRFQCKAGQRISIDILERCDGRVDCDDGIDENNCPNRHYCATKLGDLISIPKTSVLNGKQECVDGSDEYSQLFSSALNLIDDVGLKIWLWLVTIVTIFGNGYVAAMSIKTYRHKRSPDVSVCNHILIINLAVSDCLMGVYLMIILVKDIQYSGRYSKIDYEWRSSSVCSLAGSLCVISSQTSCFLMAILTGNRLFAVYCPFKARHASTTPWMVAAICSWIISFIIALVSNTTRYFKSKIIFLNEFSLSDTVTHDYVKDFACRLAVLTNTSQNVDKRSWQSVKSFLNNKFPQYAPGGEFGYYGTTSVCMPRLYVNRSDSFWIFSIIMITLNFFSFVFVLSGFALIAWKMRNRPIQSDNAQKQNVKMNQRITRIIISDFLCWVPICIMAYISVSGVKLPDGVEIFTAGVLLPINSAFNPVLYSPYIETKFKILWKKICSSDDQTPSRDAIELNVIS
ncbi:unnamed protein product [Clavelina lepadiformis]|uniref:G-protein coupled receptors family 1 profile domain-containing protein n=1 Tax=Clavelina lepadiformis TaxID=159417 RepID=A0ABP0FQX6_CLALP